MIYDIINRYMKRETAPLMSHKSKNRAAKRRAIYILPNIFTTLSLFFGFYSILASVAGRFDQAALFILFSALCDGLDGTVARMTNTTSQFGVEYDSLCDLVAFGVAPAALAYFWALTPDHLASLAPYHNKLGSAAAFIYLACGALRLARFNVFSGVRDAGYFQGLPIPGGAVIMSAAVLWHYRSGLPVMPNGQAVLALTIVLAFLMVSSLDYFSHKNKILAQNQRPFETLVFVVLLIGVIIVKLKSALLPLGFLYLASGPIVTIVRSYRRRGNRGGPDKRDRHPVGVPCETPEPETLKEAEETE
ncbi:CDP-diacylglycerol--serine O-phosphatidyltransferase [Deltaproteobacteria bacterium Smac51]|nr:CDP-diacylglycerol--serine O-phosphatidyltransferase [Deltaproteobacteria bacterium Smac51]